MRARVLLISLLLMMAGCSSTRTPVAQPSTRSYSGTASVGDFMNITVDTAALTISYTNLSNGDTSTVPYTVNSDGTYALNDPAANLVAAYEIPGYAMLLEAQKAGSDHATPALITAVAQGQITLATFENHAYNYMQFRTSSGGMEAGSAILDAQGHITVSSYSPSGYMNGQQSPFHNNTLDASRRRRRQTAPISRCLTTTAARPTMSSAPDKAFSLSIIPTARFWGYKKRPAKTLTQPSPGPTRQCFIRRPMPAPGPTIPRPALPPWAARP